jgi:hypothetical protein
MTSTSNPSPPFPKDPDDTPSIPTNTMDTVARVTLPGPDELKPEDVFMESPKVGQPGAEPAKPEELSAEELRLMADTMPGKGPGGD